MTDETTFERPNVLAAVISTLLFLAMLVFVAYRISRARSDAHPAELEAPREEGAAVLEPA